ncbi:MAG: EFR1 family ferrodoxin [Candidatus Cloacimonas sp.]|nr:EFR1 family ferrodoxin [Candidatus Cloacimonadota bacterium]
MKTKRVDFYYFSSTGNTILLVEQMKSIFESRSLEVQCHCIPNVKPEAIDIRNTTIGIAFPVAYFSSYPFVWRFLKRMPIAKGVDAFVVNSSRQHSGTIRRQLYDLLAKKGYKPIGIGEIPMPSSANFQPYDEEIYEDSVQEGVLRAEMFALSLLDNSSVWPSENMMSKLTELFKLRKLAWRFLNRDFKLVIDTMKCIRCGICYKLCPADNIEMEHYPEYLDKCQHCFRCVSYCPADAIKFKDKEKFYPHTPVPHEKILEFSL